MVENAGKCCCLALVHPDILLEAEAFPVGEEKGLGKQDWSAGEDGGVVRACHLAFDEVHNLGILDEALAHWLEDVVHHHGCSLAFDDSIAGGIELVFARWSCRQMSWSTHCRESGRSICRGRHAGPGGRG